MKNSNIVKPTGLKGNDKLNRMRELMGQAPINEGITRSVVELTKQGPDGNVYAIVRENHEYYIKVSEGKSNLVTEDFQYMGGLQNKKDKVYTSYAKAIKQLNLKFMSLNEAIGESGSFNTFKSDNLITEHHGMNPNATLSASKAIGDNDEYVIDKKGDNLKYDNKEGSEADGFGGNVAPGKAEADVKKVKLSETEKAIDSMITGEEIIEESDCNCDGDCKCRKEEVKENAPVIKDVKDIDTGKYVGTHQYGVGFKANANGKELGYSDDPKGIPNGTKMEKSMGMNETKKKGFSIARAIQEMDSVIDSIATEDDKVNDILESLGESEKAIMMEALKKNVNEIERKIHKDKKPAFTDKEEAEIDSVVRQIDTDDEDNVNESDKTSLFFEKGYEQMIINFNKYVKEKTGEIIGVNTDGIDDDYLILSLDSWLKQLQSKTPVDAKMANEIRKADNTKNAFLQAVMMFNQKDGVNEAFDIKKKV